jgi:hypothetical protein
MLESSVMARIPDYRERDESLSREQINELKRNLSLLSTPGVEDFYRSAYKECAPERKPGARAIQQLVTAWKILRHWNWR